MGKLFEKSHNWVSGKGWRSHKRVDARNRRKYGGASDEEKGQDIIAALSKPTTPMSG